ncbi:MAG: c-type cytochrome [Thiovulaceae bacterium]|nr:c-type cytochrome [Sulfurimonadaceae bacterium]
MNKGTTLLLSILALGFMATAAQADIKKGQKGYLKTCKKCHGNGTKGASMKTQDEWEELFADGAEMIIEVHEGNKKASSFFGGKKFKKLAPHLKDFLYQYGSDSGNVPSCG